MMIDFEEIHERAEADELLSLMEWFALEPVAYHVEDSVTGVEKLAHIDLVGGSTIGVPRWAPCQFDSVEEYEAWLADPDSLEVLRTHVLTDHGAAVLAEYDRKWPL